MGDNLKEIACITGAASDIGTEIAERLYKQGMNLLLCDHPNQKENIKLQYSSYIEANDSRVNFEYFDLENIESMEIIKAYHISVLINCAGVNIFKQFTEFCEKDWDTIMNVNLKGTFFLTQNVVRQMIADKIPGRIVNIGSQHGIVANGLRAPYCISKFGIVGFTKVLALELSIHGIRVNCVSPTYVYTKKSKDFLDNKDVKIAYLSKIPIHKYARPKDIAKAVVFLVDIENEMITGENLIVDGGYTIH